MNNTMKYKGYTALIEYSAEDDCFVGKVVGIRHSIVFDGTSVEEIHANFVDMIDDYPAMCVDLGQKPNAPASEIMVPIAPTLYAQIAKKAEYDGVPFSTVMESALQKFVTP